ncbi:EamA family transporter [Propionibacteriaceae bacterium G1746]
MTAAAPIPPETTATDSRQTALAALMVVGSCTSLQFGAALATQLFPAAGSWGASTARLVVAALVLLVWVRPRVSGWSRRTWTSVIIFGLTLGFMNGFFYAAVARLPLGIAVTFEFLGPLLLAAALSRRWTDLFWVLVALGGVALLGLDSLLGATSLDPVGVAFALVAAASWAAYIVAGNRVSRTLPGRDGLAVGMAIGALVTLPLGASGALRVLDDPLLVLLALGTGLLASVIPYTLEFAALRRLDPGTFGILVSLEPGIAALIGMLVMGQVLGAWSWVAVVLVIVASVGATRMRRATAA